MEKQMSRRLRLGLIVTVLVIVAVIATFWALVLDSASLAISKGEPLLQAFPR